MGLLDRIFRGRLEWCNGRIVRNSNHWTWPHRVRSGVQVLLTSKDADGQPMVLIRRQGVHCTNPAKTGDYPKSPESELWYVPMAACQACEHYRSPNRRIRYMHCVWAMEQRGGAAGAMGQVAGIVAEAKEAVKQMTS